jgi:hypothetical protein
MLYGAMAELANKTNRQLVAAITSDGESHRVGSSFFWQTRAVRCVAQIAEISNLIYGRIGSFVARRAALALPTRPKWKSCGMDPTAIVALCGGHEKRTGHEFFAMASIVLNGNVGRQC